MKFYTYRFGTLRSTRSPQQVYFILMTFFRLSRNGLCSLFSTVHREHLLAWATGSGNTDSRGCQSLHPKMTQTSWCPSYNSRADSCRGRSNPRATSARESEECWKRGGRLVQPVAPGNDRFVFTFWSYKAADATGKWGLAPKWPPAGLEESATLPFQGSGCHPLKGWSQASTHIQDCSRTGLLLLAWPQTSRVRVNPRNKRRGQSLLGRNKRPQFALEVEAVPRDILREADIGEARKIQRLAYQ